MCVSTAFRRICGSRRHRGEADRSVVPIVLLSALFKNGDNASLFQSLGTFPDCCDFSIMMEGGLATTSANSLRTLGCILSGPMDFCMFRFLRWSRTRFSLTMGRALPLWSPSYHPSTQDRQGERLPVKTEAKKFLSTSAFSSPVNTRPPFLFIRGVCFL